MPAASSEAWRREVEGEWHELLALGPRFHGTPGADAAADLLVDRIRAAGLAAVEQPFSTEGWTPTVPSTLRVTAPELRVLEGVPMLLTPGTPAGGALGGLVRHVGELVVWGGVYAWTRFAVCDASGQPLAYLCGRPDGPPIPQLLPAECRRLPHLAIGCDDASRLASWGREGVDVVVELVVGAAFSPVAAGRNIVVRLPGTGAVDGRVLVTAHYDTMWNTVGAYDNASGVVAALEIARRLSREPAACDVDLVLFSAEEWGLLGSRAHVELLRESGELEPIRSVVNLDGLGRGTEMEIWAGPEDFEARVMALLRGPLSERGLTAVGKCPPPPGSDHASFVEAGVPAAMLTFNDQAVIHRPEDTPNAECLRNLLHGATLGETLVRALAADEPA